MAFKTERSWEKGQEDVSCIALWRLGKALQRAAVLWAEMFHRKLSKKEECTSDPLLTSFFVEKGVN